MQFMIGMYWLAASGETEMMRIRDCRAIAGMDGSFEGFWGAKVGFRFDAVEGEFEEAESVCLLM